MMQNMENQDNIKRQFYELSAQNKGQFMFFIGLICICSIFSFLMFLPLSEYMIVSFLHGYVTKNGPQRTALISDEPEHSILLEPDKWQEEMDYIIKNKKDVDVYSTNHYTNWAIDLGISTPGEVRFWINPFFSLFVPAIICGALIASWLTTLMPLNIGFMRRRIEREIVYNLDKICYISNSFYSQSKNDEIEKMILAADLHDLHICGKEWHIPISELKIIHNALKWKNSSLFYRLIHPLKGLNIYLRLYFTEKYSNAILGLVYIGAAILIIIIGLRGLKFIPATQPSPIIFSLGVEFTLLFTYAFTLIFSKPEVIDTAWEQDEEKQPPSLIGNMENSKDIENILRAFIKSDKTE